MRLTLAVRSDDKVEGLGADLSSSEGAFGAHRDDGATAEVQRDVGVGNIVESDFGAFAFDNLPRVKFVEAVVGNVDGNACGVLFGDGGDEDVGAVEELELVAENVGVVGVVEEQRVDERRSIDGLLV